VQEQLTQVKSREHALKTAALAPKQVLRRLRQQWEFLKKQLKQIEAEIGKLIKSDPETRRRAECAGSAAGVGITTVAVVIAETSGFTLIDSPNQLTSYVGLDSMLRESGNHAGKVTISHSGNRHLRRALYFPAVSAMRHNPQLKALYQRVLERTRIKMKALVAVMRKLLLLVYTLWTKVECYDPQRHLAFSSAQ
jgi:transposase